MEPSTTTSASRSRPPSRASTFRGRVTIEKLLAENVDVAAELRELKSPDAREQIYRSAYFMAYADGECTKEEQALLDRIALETQTTPAQTSCAGPLVRGTSEGRGSVA